jgi:hypothetical protein
MRIFGTSIRSYFRQFQPEVPIGRTVRNFLPYGLAASGLAVGAHQLYDTCLPFQQTVDTARDFLNQHRHIYECTSAALTLGTISDFLAQRYNILKGLQQRINWWQLAKMTAFGAVTGGLFNRWLLDLNFYLFPGDSFWQIAKRVGLDQLGYTLPYLFFLLFFSYLLRSGTYTRNVFKTTAVSTLKILPLSLIIWGGCFDWITYSSSTDFGVYVRNILAIFWRSFLYHQAMELPKSQGSAPKSK